jgi:hypothetical protein
MLLSQLYRQLKPKKLIRKDLMMFYNTKRILNTILGIIVIVTVSFAQQTSLKIYHPGSQSSVAGEIQGVTDGIKLLRLNQQYKLASDGRNRVTSVYGTIFHKSGETFDGNESATISSFSSSTYPAIIAKNGNIVAVLANSSSAFYAQAPFSGTKAGIFEGDIDIDGDVLIASGNTFASDGIDPSTIPSGSPAGFVTKDLIANELLCAHSIGIGPLASPAITLWSDGNAIFNGYVQADHIIASNIHFESDDAVFDGNLEVGEILGTNGIDPDAATLPSGFSNIGIVSKEIYAQDAVVVGSDAKIVLESTDGNGIFEGYVQADEIKIGDWTIDAPDYVFKEDYNLMKLNEIEKYINEKSHLPEVPSAEEMKENGVELAKMNMLLLKKIEELTLHIIDQNKRIEKLEEKSLSSKN